PQWALWLVQVAASLIVGLPRTSPASPNGARPLRRTPMLACSWLSSSRAPQCSLAEWGEPRPCPSPRSQIWGHLHGDSACAVADATLPREHANPCKDVPDFTSTSLLI